MLDNEKINQQIGFLIEIDKVKQVLRNTILFDKSRRENDAEHSWHMAVCAMLFLEYAEDKNLDMLRVLKMIMLHDVVEIDAGDTFAYDEKGNLDKELREMKAAGRIFGLLPEEQRDEFKNLWLEFEAAVTSEAKYARAMDAFMPLLHNYQTKGFQWLNFGVTSDKVFNRARKYIKPGSESLWEYANRMIEDAVEKGYLKA